MKYEVNANVTLYVEAGSSKEAKALADEELSWSDSVETINITSCYEFYDD